MGSLGPWRALATWSLGAQESEVGADRFAIARSPGGGRRSRRSAARRWEGEGLRPWLQGVKVPRKQGTEKPWQLCAGLPRDQRNQASGRQANEAPGRLGDWAPRKLGNSTPGRRGGLVDLRSRDQGALVPRRLDAWADASKWCAGGPGFKASRLAGPLMLAVAWDPGGRAKSADRDLGGLQPRNLRDQDQRRFMLSSRLCDLDVQSACSGEIPGRRRRDRRRSRRSTQGRPGAAAGRGRGGG
jgi:hypothetical protein